MCEEGKTSKSPNKNRVKPMIKTREVREKKHTEVRKIISHLKNHFNPLINTEGHMVFVSYTRVRIFFTLIPPNSEFYLIKNSDSQPSKYNLLKRHVDSVHEGPKSYECTMCSSRCSSKNR